MDWHEEEVITNMGNAAQGAQKSAGLLQQQDLDVYAWVARHPGRSSAQVARGTGLPLETVLTAARALAEAGLLQGDAAGWTIRDPGIALAQASRSQREQMRHHQARLDELQATVALLRSCLPVAPQGRAAREADLVEVIDELEDVRDALNEESARCRHEMLTCQPGGTRDPKALEEAIRRDTELLERGVTMRTLYHHTARFNGPSQAYVARASALGAQYRTAHELFGRLIVFDRATAFLPAGDGTWGAVVIRQPGIVAYLCGIFEATWTTAEPFGDAAADGLERVAKQLDRTILRLLSAGLKDETIARRLGMSLRTLRRHIADLMLQLDAESRFQAGVRAAASGLLRADEDACEASTPKPVTAVPARDGQT
jgi:DNA-binding CsgD family transcriptional regulator